VGKFNRRVLSAWLVAAWSAIFAQPSQLPVQEMTHTGPGNYRLKVVNTLDRTITAVVVGTTVTRASDGRTLASGFSILDVAWGTFRPLNPGETWESSDAGHPGERGGMAGPGRAPETTIRAEVLAVATDAPDVRGDHKYAALIKQRRKAYHDAYGECIAMLARSQHQAVTVDSLLAQTETLQKSLAARASDDEDRRSYRGVVNGFLST